MMVGYTEAQGVWYLSKEKNNYAQLQEMVLFTISGDGQIEKEGTSWKRDLEYIHGPKLPGARQCGRTARRLFSGR